MGITYGDEMLPLRTGRPYVKRMVLVAVSTLALLTLGAKVYSFGRVNGMEEGLRSGYMQGLEDSTDGINTSDDSDEICIDGQCEAQQD